MVRQFHEFLWIQFLADFCNWAAAAVPANVATIAPFRRIWGWLKAEVTEIQDT